MNRDFKKVIVIPIAMTALLSCGHHYTEEQEEPKKSEAPARVDTGPDPTVVDVDHYRAEFENDRVRVLRIAYGPGEESIMHYHPDSVAVFLTDHHVKFGMPDGSSELADLEAGQHLFVPAGQHLPKNTGDELFELVLVELKAGGGAAAAAEAAADPTVVDADHYKAEFENERVRLVRVSYGPGEESVMHYHPDSVAVFLTDHHVEFGMPDGSSEEVHEEAGRHVYIPGGQHLPRNIGEEAWEVLLVELK